MAQDMTVRKFSQIYRQYRINYGDEHYARIPDSGLCSRDDYLFSEFKKILGVLQRKGIDPDEYLQFHLSRNCCVPPRYLRRAAAMKAFLEAAPMLRSAVISRMRPVYVARFMKFGHLTRPEAEHMTATLLGETR